MVGLGIGVFFAGYALLAYGWSQIHGANATLVQLSWPGSYQGPNLDPPGAPSPAPGTTGSTQFTPGTKPNTQVPIGKGRTTPASNLPGGPGSEVSP